MRDRASDDRREVTVNLTGVGKDFIEKVFPGHLQVVVEK